MVWELVVELPVEQAKHGVDGLWGVDERVVVPLSGRLAEQKMGLMVVVE